MLDNSFILGCLMEFCATKTVLRKFVLAENYNLVIRENLYSQNNHNINKIRKRVVYGRHVASMCTLLKLNLERGNKK